MTRWMHVALAAVWALLTIPTLLWWSESILWVLMISLYANFVGHLSAWEAARPTPPAGPTPRQQACSRLRRRASRADAGGKTRRRRTQRTPTAWAVGVRCARPLIPEHVQASGVVRAGTRPARPNRR